MNLLLDTLEGQIRNKFPDYVAYTVEVPSMDSRFPLYILTFSVPRQKKRVSLLVVTEMNVKKRRHKDDPHNATWLIRSVGPASELLSSVHGVVVSYGFSASGGEIEPDSQGNTHKSSFRRLFRVSDIVGGLYGYHEIYTTFTERNLGLFVAGKPLEDRCDYSN